MESRCHGQEQYPNMPQESWYRYQPNFIRGSETQRVLSNGFQVAEAGCQISVAWHQQGS